MTRRDEYYNRAKQEGYRTRAAYKLQQLDDACDLLHAGDTVIDLGAAPGGWLQVAGERVGTDGVVLGVDRQRIDSVETTATVETLRGDLTADSTIDAIRERIGDAGADVVISDLAPDLTGEYDLDHARSLHLARQALSVARRVLRPGGDFVVKVFDGRDLAGFVDEVDGGFGYVREVRPDASRDASSELYIVGKGRILAPVEVGDVLEVAIEGTGSKGDGVATVEGFTVFVEGAKDGETVTVEITALKERYGFARVVND